jgi:hypothetical protein
MVAVFVITTPGKITLCGCRISARQSGIGELVASLVGLHIRGTVVGLVLGGVSVLCVDGGVVESIADTESVSVPFNPSHRKALFQ